MGWVSGWGAEQGQKQEASLNGYHSLLFRLDNVLSLHPFTSRVQLGVYIVTTCGRSELG